MGYIQLDNILTNDFDIYVSNIDNIKETNIELFEEIISTDEKLRADKFKFSQDKNRFIISRAELRIIVGGYLDQTPKSIKFDYTKKGKPYITNNKLNFNISYSNKLIIYAIAKNKLIGIDIEHIQSIPNLKEISKQYFTKDEYSKICMANKKKQYELFFKCWTCKEAYLKATGKGLSGLDKISFNIPFDTDVFTITDSQKETWDSYFFYPINNYISSILIQG